MATSISKITRNQIFLFLINITRLKPHNTHKEKRQTKTFQIPFKSTCLIKQIDQLDRTIKQYEYNLHSLSLTNTNQSFPNFTKRSITLVIQGENTNSTIYPSKDYEQALIAMALSFIIILIILQCIGIKRNETPIQNQPVPKYSTKLFLHI